MSEYVMDFGDGTPATLTQDVFDYVLDLGLATPPTAPNDVTVGTVSTVDPDGVFLYRGQPVDEVRAGELFSRGLTAVLRQALDQHRGTRSPSLFADDFDED